MDQNLINFIVTVAANVIADYISKWLESSQGQVSTNTLGVAAPRVLLFGDEPNRQS